jgi:hypothetical protein
MTLKLRDVRIAQLAVDASLDAVDGKAAGPLAAVGNYPGYRDLFTAALASENGVELPWHPDTPHHNKFWANYVSGRPSDGDAEGAARIAWDGLMPFKAPAAIVAGTLPGVRRSFAEAYVWPTGYGFCRNYWIEGAIEPAEIARMVGEANDLQRRHETLNAVRKDMWGEGEAGVRSDLMTIVSVVRMEAGSEDDEAAALKAILDGLEFDERPRILPADEQANKRTVHCAGDFRLVWQPNKARSSRRMHSLGCFHRNLTLAALQARMIGETVVALDDRRAGGALPTAYGALVDRLRDGLGRFWTPHVAAWVGGDTIGQARRAIGL